MSEFMANSFQLRARDVKVDVIVPVYRGLEQTRACIESVLASRQQVNFELTVIDDCSPEPELTAWIDAMARSYHFTLLKNHHNLGFVRSVNRGMELHLENDAVLLNSDATVANNWLDRLAKCAYADALIATVTPFSNNAIICSYPAFCVNNTLPPELGVAELDAIFASVNRGCMVELPTGVGFCIYIRRDAIDEIGLFDAARFGKGYGEENDFCQRAIKRGRKNVLAADVFVQHSGGVSFAAEQDARKARAMEVLTELHPNYVDDVQKFILADPVRRFRLGVDFRRLATGELPVILAISHDGGGGTQKHIDELGRLLVGKAHCLLLRPLDDRVLELVWNQPGEALNLRFDLGTEYDLLLEILHAARVCRVHFHTLLDVPPRLQKIARDLDLPYDFTAHDYYSICPKIYFNYAAEPRYCEEKGVAQCKTCLQASPALGHIDISAWRSGSEKMLRNASRVFAPGPDAAVRLKRYFPDVEITMAPHPEPAPIFSEPQNPADLAAESPLRIFVLGALDKIKGADLLEACAIDAGQRNLLLSFELIGFSYRKLMTFPKSPLRVHGRYEDGDLQGLLAYHAPDLIWFPVRIPETYSYTLSAAFAARLPVAAPNLGAFAERMAGRRLSWIYDWKMTPAEINDWLVSLRTRHFANGVKVDSCAGAGAEYVRAFYYPADYLRPVEIQRRPEHADSVFSALAAKICARASSDRPLRASLRYGAKKRSHGDAERAASPGQPLSARYPRLSMIVRRTVKLVRWSLTFQLLEKYRQRQERLALMSHVAPPTDDHALAVPLSYVQLPTGCAPSLAVICHMYFDDLAAEFKAYLSNIPFHFDLYITTDTGEKKLNIEKVFTGWVRGKIDVRISPNRGRDIAPKLITFNSVYDQYEYILHIHTKRSVHADDLAGWRKYLLESLLGSPEIVASIFEVFENHPRIGLIAPQHMEGIRPGIGWGLNYETAKAFSRRLALELHLNDRIDFPSGSMFFARSAALKPVLNLGLNFDDFPLEKGQSDGTLAHVIERLYFHICEVAGYDWIKIARPELLHETRYRSVDVNGPEDLSDFVEFHRVRLLTEGHARVNSSARKPDRDDGPRLSLPQIRLLRRAHKISVYRILDFPEFVSAVMSLADGLPSTIDFDEMFYLASNPDVHEAVKSGGFPCGYIHYCMEGKNEGRRWRKAQVAGWRQPYAAAQSR